MRIVSILALALPVFSAASVVSKSYSQPFFYKGHDLSSLKTLEDDGHRFKDTARRNQTRPVEDILGDGGMNTVRLRIWVNPVGGTNGLEYTIELAKRFQEKGYKIFLDFHFSDSWADPKKQTLPAAWPTTLKPLASTLRTYVKSTLISFKRAGVNLNIVALGNEIRNGMLWPLGYVDVDMKPWSAAVAKFSGFATLYKAAREGVDDAIRAGVRKPEVMIHVDNGWDVTLQQRWYAALIASGVKESAFDIIGVSFYPFYDTAATFDNLKHSLNTLANQYRKPLQVVETDYPAVCNGKWKPIPHSSEPSIPYGIGGQITWTKKVIEIVKAVPYGLGRGVHYWEPAWLNNTSLGSDCNDAILFTPDFTNFPKIVGYSRPSVDIFK